MSAQSWFAVALACGVSLGAVLEQHREAWQPEEGRWERGFMVRGFGHARALLAGQFFTKADKYFHSGYYPTIFDDRSSFHTPHMALYSEVVDQERNAREAARSKPALNIVVTDDEGGTPGIGPDWIARLGQNFRVVRHTHLDQRGDPGKLRELLPWLWLSIQLEPERGERYVIASFWLRNYLQRPDEAEALLREGWRRNPDSPEILFELGRLANEHRQDTARARNLWHLAVRAWNRSEAELEEPNDFLLAQILVHLATLHDAVGEPALALAWWKRAAEVTPSRDALALRMRASLSRLAALEPVQGLPHPESPL